MDKTYEIVTDFGESEVGLKSRGNLPSLFRSWPSVDSEVALYQRDWNKLCRRTNVVGYPPFDMFSEWLMDFASITAYHLGRNDWRNFRQMILVHIPKCPFFCWYCFNDAWKNCKKITCKKYSAKRIVSEFIKYRNSNSEQFNILRVSGGEPFLEPGLIQDIAIQFGIESRKSGNENVFLWIDTNLFPFNNGLTQDQKRSLAALKKLRNKVAIHACIHGGSDQSFKANTGCKVKYKNIIKSIKEIVSYNLHVYPRINPIGLKPKETEAIFYDLLRIDKSLPMKTYLGPIELFYDSAVDRMKIFQGKKPVNDIDAYTKKIKQDVIFRPPNAVTFTWNHLMECCYGFGYGIVPRHLKVNLKHVKSKRGHHEISRKTIWKEMILLSKGWEKEAYTLKLLELLALPKGAVIDVEYENRWTEPTFLSHVFSADEYYQGSGVKVLFFGSQPQPGSEPNIIPLRWGLISSMKTTAPSKKHSLDFKIRLGDYAEDFKADFLKNKNGSIANELAKYIGRHKLPFTNKTTGHFCQFVGLEMLRGKEISSNKTKAAFKSTVLEIVDSRYSKTKKDIYYCIKEIRDRKGDKKELNKNGKLNIKEGEELTFLVEVFNPNLGNEGYAQLNETRMNVISTESEVSISPDVITLSKYGEIEIYVKFPQRSSEFEGALIFKPVDINSRIAEIKIPYSLKIEG